MRSTHLNYKVNTPHQSEHRKKNTEDEVRPEIHVQFADTSSRK